ncbi:MAG: DNA recombination protein RmuC [Anaerolineae bacterium]|jgi:DNA recombination protein RmuC|nr:DNA recombination protein RmuC [Chloroflexota bacterium]
METEVVLLIMLLVQTACLVAVTAALVRRSGAGFAPQDYRRLMEAVQEDQTELARLGEGLSPLHQSVGSIRESLAELQGSIRAREDIERSTADAIQRLERVISGTQSRGAAGENLLDLVFSQLPPDWQVRNLRVGNKVVEFGLRLPNGLLLPIDSKWAATNLLERLHQTEEPVKRQQIKALLEATVLARTREVRKYIDPNRTVGYALAVVPDAVFELCSAIQAEAFATNVVLVGQSLFLPYLLLVFQTVLKSTQSIDLQRFELYVSSCQQDIATMQEELEGRYSRATTMLENSRRELASGLARVQGDLNSLRRNAETLPVDAEAFKPATVEVSDEEIEQDSDWEWEDDEAGA